jgi:hypothetical protein
MESFLEFCPTKKILADLLRSRTYFNKNFLYLAYIVDIWNHYHTNKSVKL